MWSAACLPEAVGGLSFSAGVRVSMAISMHGKTGNQNISHEHFCSLGSILPDFLASVA